MAVKECLQALRALAAGSITQAIARGMEQDKTRKLKLRYHPFYQNNEEVSCLEPNENLNSFLCYYCQVWQLIKSPPSHTHTILSILSLLSSHILWSCQSTTCMASEVKGSLVITLFRLSTCVPTQNSQQPLFVMQGFQLGVKVPPHFFNGLWSRMLGNRLSQGECIKAKRNRISCPY